MSRRYIVSPHLDDAVLSLGQHIAAPHTLDSPVEIVTVFAGKPAATVRTPYDEVTGFVTSRDAVTERIAEDDRACAVLGADPHRYAYLDHQYQSSRTMSEFDSLVAGLRKLWQTEETQVYVPLGIGHPDHYFVADAAARACPMQFSVMVYEELPYRVLHPEQVTDALARWADRGFARQEVVAPLAVGDLAIKRNAIAQYASQFPNGAEDPCLLVPERCWLMQKIARTE